MKIFISWSRKISRTVAESFRELLPYVFERIEPFASFEDIPKGQQGVSRILQELENTNLGIICITPENINAPWLNFEAGALAKTQNSQIFTFLFGITRKELGNSPLEGFQSTNYEKDDVKKLIIDINKNYEVPLTETQLNKKFEHFWTDLETKLNPLYPKPQIILILEEIGLDLTQEIQELKDTFANITLETYPIEQITALPPTPDLIIYIYSQSPESQTKLQKTIDYVQSYPLPPSLIIYTLDNKKLENNEYLIAKSYKLANFPGTLIDRCKEILQ